jgi:hypothetical protein
MLIRRDQQQSKDTLVTLGGVIYVGKERTAPEIALSSLSIPKKSFLREKSTAMFSRFHYDRPSRDIIYAIVRHAKPVTRCNIPLVT